MLQSLVDEFEPALAQRHKNEVEEHAPDVIFEAVSLGDHQHLLELPASVLEIRARVDDGETRESADTRLRVAEALCELERSSTPCHSRLPVLDDRLSLRDVAVRQRELPPGRQPLEHLDRLERNRLALVGPAREEEQTRQGAQRVSFSAEVPELAPALERLLLGGDRFLELRRHVALVGTTSRQLRTSREREMLPDPQRPCELCSSLAVGPYRRGSLTGCRGEPQHRLGFACGLCVVGQPRKVLGGRRMPDECT